MPSSRFTTTHLLEQLEHRLGCHTRRQPGSGCIENPGGTHIVESGPFVVSQTWASYAPQNRPSLLYELEEGANPGEPIVAIYGTGKYIIANPIHVQQHRDTCLARLGDAAIDRVLGDRDSASLQG